MTAPNQIYQYSIISSLAQGICADGIPVDQLLSKGDHGLGTLARLDGEVTIIDGHAYQFTSTGGARAVEPSDITPFLMTTYFKPTKSVAVPYLTNETILEEISNIYPLSTNSFFAIRVDGVFPKITYRIAPPQSHPRETLTEVVERQTVRSFESQKGTIFGFWSPEFTSAFSVAGLHLHFLSEDRKAGGHILQFNAEDAILSAAVIRKYTVQLPETKEFSSEVIVEPDRNIVSKAERM